MRRWLIVVLAVLAAAAVVPFVVLAIGDEEPTDEPAPGAARVIDELRGTYRGVGLGDSAEDVRRVLGPPGFSGIRAPITPLAADNMSFGGPVAITNPKPRASAHRRRQEPLKLRYRDVSFLLLEDRVYMLMITDHGAATQQGVAIGHDLDAADERYEYLNCATASFHESDDTFPYCAGALTRRRHIWFGEDPIQSITIATTSFSGWECPRQPPQGRPRRDPGPFLRCP